MLERKLVTIMFCAKKKDRYEYLSWEVS
jgi:hypothetical protein